MKAPHLPPTNTTVPRDEVDGCILCIETSVISSVECSTLVQCHRWLCDTLGRVTQLSSQEWSWRPHLPSSNTVICCVHLGVTFMQSNILGGI